MFKAFSSIFFLLNSRFRRPPEVCGHWRKLCVRQQRQRPVKQQAGGAGETRLRVTLLDQLGPVSAKASGSSVFHSERSTFLSP